MEDSQYTGEETYQATTEDMTYEPNDQDMSTEDAQAPDQSGEVQSQVDEATATEDSVDSKAYLAKQAEVFKSLSDENLDLMSLYETEYMKNGDYSEATYKALEAKGWSKENIDVVSNAIQITTQTFCDKVVSIAGNEQNYQAIQGWARQNASDADLNRYNEAITTGDLAYVNLQLSAWKNQYQSGVGKQPNVTLQNLHAGTASNGPAPFESLAEQTRAINDPRFREGGRYRNETLQRMMNSKFSYR